MGRGGACETGRATTAGGFCSGEGVVPLIEVTGGLGERGRKDSEGKEKGYQRVMEGD